MPKEILNFNFVKAKEKFGFLELNEKFLAHVRRLRKKWHIPDEGFNKEETMIDWEGQIYGSEKKRKEFREDMKELRKKSDFGENNHDAIKFYLLRNKITPISSSIFILPIYPSEENGHEAAIYLKIFPETNLEDVKIEWPAVTRWQEEFWGRDPEKRYRLIEDFEKKKRIFELRTKKNYTFNEIAEKINEEYPGSKLTYDKATKIYHDFLEKVNIAYKESL